MLNSKLSEWKHMSEKEKSEWEEFYKKVTSKPDPADLPWTKYKEGFLPPRPTITHIPWGDDDT